MNSQRRRRRTRRRMRQYRRKTSMTVSLTPLLPSVRTYHGRWASILFADYWLDCVLLFVSMSISGFQYPDQSLLASLLCISRFVQMQPGCPKHCDVSQANPTLPFVALKTIADPWLQSTVEKKAPLKRERESRGDPGYG
jgi:hypothetical protein